MIVINIIAFTFSAKKKQLTDIPYGILRIDA